MTSQGMILTKHNSIFVSDKQQTNAYGKSYGGIDKIFSISHKHSSRIMINGTADFENIPVERSIKEFSKYTDFKKMKTNKDKLAEHISQNTSTTAREEYGENKIEQYKYDLKKEINTYRFDETLKTKYKREMCSFIKDYSKFEDEFEGIVPAHKDYKKYNEVLWRIFSYELQY